ncbi:MAG TPA: DHH family phosphoesterase [Oscillospiraceae bacterium]|nr:DHH family phosphoesterase [Oscillospiraceae bacterium]HPS33634.1 DHH family phosphoesterase [Oscillospiraceae bacterium]
MEIAGCSKESFFLLKQLVLESDSVIVSGHKNSDFDTLGSAYGIYSLVREMGKTARIVVNTETNLAVPLIDKIQKAEQSEVFISPEQAGELAKADVLSVITDTNRASLLECPFLFEICERTVIVDHHQLRSDLTDYEGLFIHNERASSTCEMAAELISYSEMTPSTVLCEALAAGIMLDTRNFTQKTTPKTFFVAGSLFAMGADITDTRNLFGCSLDHYRQRTKLVLSAKMLKGCAIAVAGINKPGIRVLAPQAANELLTIKGVKASFVVYRGEGEACISARSDGRLDVAEIMEQLGGGGNSVMAAAQLPGVGRYAAFRRLERVIGAYTGNETDTDTEENETQN